MSNSPYDIKQGETLVTDAKGVSVDRGFIAHFQVDADKATAGSNTAVLAATTLTAEAQTIIENIINPTVPRNINIVGNAVGMAGNVVIKGTNYNGDPITETLALNATTAVEGNESFKTVTEIDLPVQTVAGNTVSVGVGEKLGLPYKLSNAIILATYLNNKAETTAPIIATDSTVLENNTLKLNSALSGSVVDVYFII